MPTLAELHYSRQANIEQADRMLAAAERDGRRTLDDREQVRFDRLHATAAELQQQIESEAGRVVEATEAAAPDFGVRVGTLRGRGVYVARGTAEAYRARAGYAAAWQAAAIHGKPFAMGTAPADGGFHLAPPQFVVGVLHGLDDGNWFRSLATVRPPTTAPDVHQATRTAQAECVYWSDTIPDEVPADQPQYGGYRLVPHWLSGMFVVAHGVAAAPGGDAAVRAELVAAAAAVEEEAFVAGDGAGKPLGLFFAGKPGQGIGTDRDVTAAYGSSVDAWTSAKLGLRSVYLRSPSLRYVMHPSAYKLALTIKDSAGYPLVTRPSQAGEPGHIDGTRIELTDDAPTGTGGGGAYQSGDYLAVVGDLKQYDVQDGLDFGVNRHDDGDNARRGLFTYIFRRKVDGCPRVPEAFARLKLA